jgi:hypothetical protein
LSLVILFEGTFARKRLSKVFQITPQRISDAFQVPKGFECTFFGAYEVTDKGSSWVAPLIAALIMSNSKTLCGVQKDGHIFQLKSVIAI